MTYITRRSLLLMGSAAALALGGLAMAQTTTPAPDAPAAAPAPAAPAPDAAAPAPAAPEVTVPSDPKEALAMPSPLGDMVEGNPDAKVTIIEYASATCPHCAEFATNEYKKLKTEYIDTGKVKYIFREFPLDDVALAAHMMTRCLPKEKYFPLVDVIFAQQGEWIKSPLEGLKAIGKQAGMSEDAFMACLKNETVAKGIMTTRAAGSKAGVQGVPALFINGEVFTEERTIEKLREKIDPLLK